MWLPRAKEAHHPVAPQRQRLGGRAEEDPGECRAHAGLRDRGSGRRARDAPVEAVDEEELEHEVHGVAGNHDHEREAQVRDPAQVALPGEGDEHERQPDRRDAQVGDGEVAGLAAAAHRRGDRRGGRGGDDQQGEPDPEREPESLAGYLVGITAPACAVEAGDLGGGGVAQEIEDAEERRQHGTGQAERGELVDAQVPDDRRVGQDVERLGGERAERRAERSR